MTPGLRWPVLRLNGPSSDQDNAVPLLQFNPLVAQIRPTKSREMHGLTLLMDSCVNGALSAITIGTTRHIQLPPPEAAPVGLLPVLAFAFE